MRNERLINLVNSILGDGKRTSKGNLSYKCPKCSHHKNKLEVNFDPSSPNYQNFGCWVCGFKGKKLTTLFKFLKTHKSKFEELGKITKEKIYITSPTTVDYVKPKLPKEFKSLNTVSNDITFKHAMRYLKSRNITELDIIKYNLGYCEYGEYAKRIIIPSYDENGELNFFITRSFEEDPFQPYKNPDLPRDIVPFELFINWDSPIILCEGPFDAMAIKRNAIPLLGKTFSQSLLKKLALSKVKKIYIALDDDAKTKSLEHCEYLLNEGKKVHFIELNGKDPSNIGFNNFIKLIQNSKPLTYYGLMEKKLSL